MTTSIKTQTATTVLTALNTQADTLAAIDSMSQSRLARMASLAQEAISGKRKSKSVLATLRAMAQELQDDINYMAEVAGCNYVAAR